MARLRYNGLVAALGADLTTGGTAVTFAAALTHSGGTAVPTIGAGDHIPLSILDSNSRLVEVVYLTTYTAGDLTGTITRAREGTTAAARASGSPIIGGVLVSDVTLDPMKYVTGSRQVGTTYPKGTVIKDGPILWHANVDTNATPSLAADYAQSFAADPSGSGGWSKFDEVARASTYTFNSPVSPDFPGTPPRGGTSGVRMSNGSDGVMVLRLAVTQPAAGTITFDDSASSEGGFDKGSFWIDGVKQHEVSGTGNLWATRTYALPAGAHNLDWKYSRDGSGASGANAYIVVGLTISNFYAADWSPIGYVPTSASAPTQYTDEMAQDAVAAALTSGSHNGVAVAYDDAGNKINLSAVPATKCSYVAGASGTGDPNAATTVVPVGVQVGDLAVLAVGAQGSMTGSTGWTAVYTDTNMSGSGFYGSNTSVVYRVVDQAYLTANKAAAGVVQNGGGNAAWGVVYMRPPTGSTIASVGAGTKTLTPSRSSDPVVPAITANAVLVMAATNAGTAPPVQTPPPVAAGSVTARNGFTALMVAAYTADAASATAYANNGAENGSIVLPVNLTTITYARQATSTRYTAVQTNTAYPIPQGAQMLRLRVQAGGGAGGSGRRGAAGSVRSGGGGGGGGGHTEFDIPVADIGTSTIYVTVGPGGTGATGAAADDTNGTGGGGGGASHVLTNTAAVTAANVLARSPAGSGGVGGTTASTSGGAGGFGRWPGSPGGVGGAAGAGGAAAFGSSPYGGGGGGGVSAADAAGNGGPGNYALGTMNVAPLPGTAPGGAGADGALPLLFTYGQSGGGGGGHNAGSGGKGGNGSRGAGGGGGGGSVNGFASGAGGNGGDGFVEIIAYF